MSNGPQMFQINLEDREAQVLTEQDSSRSKLTEVNFADLGLTERSDLQEWIAAKPDILGDDLLIIGKEFRDFDRTDERVDLVAVDRDGKLVVIELKRDDSGTDVHGQAIKYASYLGDATQEEIVGMLAYHKLISGADAEAKLREHIEANDLSTLNHDQRIILASHRFAPQVRSAVLWLNEKATSENLITCVQLMPYQDEETGFLYLESSTIIPGTVIDDYKIRIYSDETTDFLRKVGRLATDSLSDEIRPNKTSRRAEVWNDICYYDFFYLRSPWDMKGGWGTYYRVHWYPYEQKADVTFKHEPQGMNVNFDFDDIIKRIGALYQQQVEDRLKRIRVELEGDTLNDNFARKIADELRQLIETITPVVDELASESEWEA